MERRSIRIEGPREDEGPREREAAPAGRSRRGDAPEVVRIPNRASYFPVALADVQATAPLAARVVLGSWGPGRVLQAAALGAYALFSLEDWFHRMRVRKIDFQTAFGADGHDFEPLTAEERRREASELVERLNDAYVPLRVSRERLARETDRHLTDTIASYTGQRVETSCEVRDFMLASLIFPFALGGCDLLSGDVGIFRRVGAFEPHVLAHEFAHRKGYLRELEAQALAYLSNARSQDPVLVQAARCERLFCHLWVLSDRRGAAYRERLDESGLRPELRADFRRRRPEPGAYERAVGGVMRRVYEAIMRLTGQNGLSDYDENFTSFLRSARISA